MKKKVLILLVAIFSLGCINVSALENETEIYYTNKNGVELTEKEYNFVKDFYNEERLENMTARDYEWISDLDINNKEVEMNVYFDIPNNITRGTSVQTPAKKLAISKSCNSLFCTVVTAVTWLGNPSVKSYDVMGARFSNATKYNDTIYTFSSSSTEDNLVSNYKVVSNGFGNSFKLPTTGSNVGADQKFYMKPGGRVYASYQHAVKSVSLATSKSYNVAAIGYGNVFDFTGSAIDCYDAMPGVDIAL